MNKLSDIKQEHLEAITRLDALTKCLANKYPEVRLTFGYIGNIYESEDLDERGWKFFTRLPPVPGDRDFYGSPGFPHYGVATVKLPELLKQAEKELEPWLRKHLNITCTHT